jgi:DNA-directed RNA polymerase subunit RPC12/RpoP
MGERASYTNGTDASEWVCARCGEPLKLSRVTVAYLGNEFPVDLYKCERCGLVLVTEDLAMGKMAEVEQTLEDK